MLGRTSSRRARQQKRENYGEARVRQVLSSAFSGKEYHLLNDITLPFEDGTTQIDHMLISRYGIFVIETKTFSGWIFSSAESPKWTQVIYHMKHNFQNPIRQNYRHVLAVRRLLDFLTEEPLVPIVVFAGDGIFRGGQPQGVFYLADVVDHISSFQREVISQNRMQFCVGRVETERLQISHLTDVQHQRYLNRKYGNA